MLKALFEFDMSKKPEKKKPKQILFGKWVIAALAELADMDLQAMLDAMPSKGGKIFIANGVYELSEPLRLPDNTDGKITITGCTFIGKDKPRTVVPGTVMIEGVTKNVFWGGSGWKASVEDAARFETKEQAEDAAFELVSKQPKYIACVEIVRA